MESGAASDSPRAGGPARNRYIYIYRGAPNYRFVAFFRPLFARSPVSRVPFFAFFPFSLYFFFYFIGRPTKSAAS